MDRKIAKKDRKIAKKDRKIALLSFYLLSKYENTVPTPMLSRLVGWCGRDGAINMTPFQYNTEESGLFTGSPLTLVAFLRRRSTTINSAIGISNKSKLTGKK